MTMCKFNAGTSLQLWLFLTVPLLCRSQSYYGGVRGQIADPSAAPVANAQVVLRDEGTGAVRSTSATSDGEYVFSQVVPGTFSLTVHHPGLKTFERHNIVIPTQQQITLNVQLELGQTTKRVIVTEQVPLIESANASQGQMLDNQKLVDLPNLGRNPFMLAKLAQNVMPVGPPAFNRMQDQSGVAQISIAGGPVQSNNYLLDGIPITDGANRTIIIPSLEAIREVKVQANTYDASMARTAGGIFNSYLKSGSNDFHGSLYGHLRETDWDANYFFDNAAGLPLADQPNKTYGASFGGPVWLPKIYNGRNKTFFWLAWEGYNDTQAASQVFAKPTALERSGNFSQSKVPNGSPLIIYDPLSTIQNADGSYTRTPFPGNVIPANRISRVGKNIANTYVSPTSAAAYYGAPNVNASTTLPSRAVQYTAKLDHQILSWWRASLSYARYFSLEPGSTWFTSISSPGQDRLQRRVDATQFNNLFTVSPRTVVTARYGFNRFPNYGYVASQGFDVGSLGFNPSFVSQIASPTFPFIGMQSQYSLGSINNFFYVGSSRSVSADVSHEAGQHNINAGFDYRRIRSDDNDLGASAGSFQFSNVFTRADPRIDNETSGADLAGLLLGYPDSGSAFRSTKLHDYADYYGLYIQDTYRILPRLTINYGLRWERETGLAENNNGLVVGFDGTKVNPLAAGVTGIIPKGVVQFAGVNGNRTTVGNPNLNKLGPRAGVVFQLDSKTVVRGGYGLFWGPQFAIAGPLSPPGYTASTSYIATVNGFATPAGTLDNPFPNGLAQPVGNSLGNATANGQSISLVDPNAKSPRVHQYSVDVQRELPGGVALQVGYVGSHSSHLVLGTANVNINALNPSYFSLGNSLNDSVPNPFYNHGGTGILSTPQVPRYQLLLPFPTFGAVNLFWSDKSHARYDSMVIKAQKRFDYGITFLSTLTWSKKLDASSGGAGTSLNCCAQGAQNPYDFNAEYSLSNTDAPLRWATAFTYELPFGRGRAFLSNRHLLNYAVGGWSLNGVAIYQSGFPIQVYQSSDLNGAYGYASQRPNATGVSPSTPGTVHDRLNDYINPAAFSQAPQLTFGNVSRTIPLRGPAKRTGTFRCSRSLRLLKE